MNHPAIQARRSDGGSSGYVAKASPEKLASNISRQLGKGEYLAARDLARSAVDRFPEDARLRKLFDLLDPRGKASIRPGGRQPDRQDESAWLRDPPEWARGQWVALIGSEVIAAAASFDEVERAVAAAAPAKRPLFHHVE